MAGALGQVGNGQQFSEMRPMGASSGFNPFSQERMAALNNDPQFREMQRVQGGGYDAQGRPVDGLGNVIERTAPSGTPASLLQSFPMQNINDFATGGGRLNPQTGEFNSAGLGNPVGYDQFGQSLGYNPSSSLTPSRVSAPAPRFLPSEPITPGTGSNISAVQPFLNEGLRQAQELFLRQQPQMFPGQTYVSPSEQTLTALQAQENIARQQSPVLGAAQGAFLQSLGGISNTAAGQYLNANPYQQQMIQAATRPLEQAFSNQVLPGISSLYSKSGRLGSGSMERALSSASEGFGRSLGDITSNIAGTQFQQERGLQQAASLQLANLAQQAPALYGQQFIPAQQLAQVGAQREAIEAQPLQEAMNRFSYEQQLPYQQLSGFLSSVYGSPLGSFGVPNPVQPANRTTGALAGGLAGGLGGYALGQAFPSIGGFAGGYGAPVLGAIGGGLLGGFL
jgi:hypothetical protein